tara:strand:+ start:36 stop:374 length:339 start_codon:yes stop_codon:yes gene_type:complete
MAGNRGGLHNYTVQEGQNAVLGQAGALLTNDTSNDIDAPTGTTWVALQIIDDVTFTTLTQESNRWYGSAAGATDLDDNGDSTSGITFSAGMTIYGRWSTFRLAGGTVIAYLG